MNRSNLLLSLLALGLVSGCADLTDNQRRTATGGGIGALAGAVIGSATGGSAATGAVIGAGVGALGSYIWSRHMEDQKRAMEEASQGSGVSVSQTADNQLKLEIPSDISFASGSSEIQPRLRPILDRFADSLNQNPGTEVRILGYTDNTGSDALNYPLSRDRAVATRDYLAARGVAFNRIHVEGLGPQNPVASNASAQGRSENRRVEIYVGQRG